MSIMGSKRVVLELRLRQKASTGMHLLGYTLLLSHLTFIPYAYAGPTGGAIVGGVGDIQQSGLTTTIHQNSSSLAINWDSYNLNSSEVVNYLQPSASAIALNRILGNDASQIYGQINANGQVILVNPNGIFFGKTAAINVGGLIASGLDISPDDFMNGKYIFNAVQGTAGTVVNSGLLNAATGGNVGLLGTQIKNEGFISANLGAVNLAAGKQAVLTFDDAGLIGIRVTQAVLQDELGVDAAVSNSGNITAKGGRILLTASQSQDIFSQAVNTGDITQATSVVVNQDGTFTLGSGADVVNSGRLDVSTSAANSNGGRVALLGQNVTSSGTIMADAQQGSGGDIELDSFDTTLLIDSSVTTARSENDGEGGIVKMLGDKVNLLGQSTVDVSGATGGGQALIGGDYQGKNALIRNASQTYVSDNAQIHADALQSGDGGKIINWSNDYTSFYGSASARGGSISGNGGFVEISGDGVSFDGQVDTTAVNGEFGDLLFDPTNIEILNGGTCNYNPYCGSLTSGSASATTSSQTPDTLYLTEAQIEGSSTGVTLQAKNSITLDNLQDNNLTLSHSLTMTAGSGFTMKDTKDTIVANGQQVNISAASITAGNIDTSGGQDQAGGAVSLTVTGDLQVSTIKSFGGTAGSGKPGQDGGSITLTSTAGSITVSGALDSKGTGGNPSNNKPKQTGGAGGQIKLTAGAGINISGTVTATGGTGYGNTSSTGASDAGAGGSIALTSTSGLVTVINSIDSSGGSASGGKGGNAGTIDLSNSGAITVGVLTAKGGTSSSGTAGSGGNINIGVISNGAITSSSGAVNTGNIMANGATVTIGAASASTGATSITTGSIDTHGYAGQTGGAVTLVSTGGGATVGVINSQGGSASDGGAITLNSTTNGDVAITALNSSGGASGGKAGAIAVTVQAGNLTVQSGGIYADGGDSNSDAAAIALHADSGAIDLKGSVSAQGNNVANGTSADITLSAQAVTIDGGSAQTIDGASAVTVTSSVSPVVLKQSLTINAGTDATVNGDIDYNGIGSGGNLTIKAGDNVTLSNVSDGNNSGDQLTVNLTGDNNSNLVGYVQAGKVTTQGGGITIDGVSITTGDLVTTGGTGQAGGDIKLTAHDGDLSVGAIDSEGGAASANSNGNNGGSITLVATSPAATANIKVGGAINSSGSAGYTGAGTANGTNGGTAGAISLTANSGNISLVGNITADGGAYGTITKKTCIAFDINGACTSYQTTYPYGTAGNGNSIALSAQNTLFASGTTALQLDSGTGSAANVTITGNIDYDGVGTTGSLTINAGNNINLSGGSILDGATTSDGDKLAVSLTAVNTIGTDTTGNITTQGGKVTINAASITTGDINTTGGTDQAGGVVSLTSTAPASGGITVGAITSTGGTASSGTNGTAGGYVSLSSTTNNITVNGAVDSSGSAGNGTTQNGGAAGTITLYAPGTVTVAGALTANGGAAAGTGSDGSGGAITLAGGNSGGSLTSSGVVDVVGNIAASGANVKIDAASITTGGITTTGGKDQAGGAVTLTSTDATNGGITVDAITSTGGTASSGNNGTTGGNVSLSSTSNNITVNGAVDSSGSAGNGTTQNGGAAGTITLYAPGTITAAGALTANGGAAAGTGSDGAGGAITLGDLDASSNLVSSGAVNTGNIAAYGAAVTIDASSITTGGIDTHGPIGQAGGAVALTFTGTTGGNISVGSIDTYGGAAASSTSNGANGGNITLNSMGKITASGALNSGGGAATGGVGGNAGTIALTADGSMLLQGSDISADGGSGGAAQGDAATITLQANSGTMDLQGNVSAQGNITNNTSANITLSAQTLNIDGTSTQTIDGATAVNVTSSGNPLALMQSLTVTAGTDASITSANGDINYDGIGTLGSLAVNAGDNITLNGGISDSTPDTDQLTVTLTGDTNSNSSGNVTIIGNVTTDGGAFKADGVTYSNPATNITTQGGSATISASSGSIAAGTINTSGQTGQAGGAVSLTSSASTGGGITVGAINSQGGSGADGGAISLNSTSGDIAVTGDGSTTLNSSGGATRGNAEAITVTAQAGNLMVKNGDIHADGGNSDAAAIALHADSGTIDLQGSVFAQGNNVANGTSADITLSTQTLNIDGVTAQTIDGATAVNVTSSGNTLALKQSLTVTAGTDANINGNINYDGIGPTGGLAVNAGNNVTLIGNISDFTPDTDQLTVTLNGQANTNSSANIAINGNITTGGGAFKAYGVAYDNSAYTIDTGTTGNATIAMSGDVALGNMMVGGALAVSAGLSGANGVTQNSGTSLSVVGTSNFSTAANNADIVLNSSGNNLQGEISFTNAGDGQADIALTNASANTVIGSTTVNGNLTVDAKNGLIINGPVNGANTNASGSTTTLAFNFGQNGPSTFTLSGNSAIKESSVGSGDHVNISIAGGADDSIALGSGSQLSTSGNLSLDAGTLTDSGASISAGTLFLKNMSSVANPITTTVDYLNVANVGANVVINETDGISFTGDNSLTGSGSLALTAGGDIQEASGATLVSPNTLALTATTGSIALNGSNQLGDLDLTATSGDVSVTNSSGVNFANLATNQLTVSSQGAITQSGNVDITGLSVLNAQSIAINDGNTNGLSINGINTSGYVNVEANNLSLAGNVATPGTVSLDSHQSITGAGVISANRVDLQAQSGIGDASNALNTNASVLNAQTAVGPINMANSGAVTLEMMKTGAGTITFSNDNSVAIDRVQTDMVSGQVQLTAGGDITGVGSTPPYTYDGADVAAYTVDLYATGNLGTTTRPVVVYAPGDINTFSRISFAPVFLPVSRTSTVTDTSLLHFSAFDTLTSLAGEQVTQVEDIDNIDPAIFTDVHNYNLADISIRLPADQLYGDEQQ